MFAFKLASYLLIAASKPNLNIHNSFIHKHGAYVCVASQAYGSSVRGQSKRLPGELEKVQIMAARSVTGSCTYETGSMTGILDKPKWTCLHRKQ